MGPLQTIASYEAIFGSPAAGASAQAPSTPLHTLVDTCLREYLAVARAAVARQCELAAARSAPLHSTAAFDMCSQAWAQDGAHRLDDVFSGDFGVPALLAVLQQLQHDAAELWHSAALFDLQAAMQELSLGALRYAPTASCLCLATLSSSRAWRLAKQGLAGLQVATPTSVCLHHRCQHHTLGCGAFAKQCGCMLNLPAGCDRDRRGLLVCILVF